mmetsp:Transcript_26303/g.56395  ORF Transcript_26303/g.56395 Transcript_26303/m.56395 type:complete len:229 (+) Transcript_26303:138-824(+)
MRFESPDFIKSRSQWQVSREWNKNGVCNVDPTSESILSNDTGRVNNYVCSINERTARINKSNDCSAGSNYLSDDNDVRDDGCTDDTNQEAGYIPEDAPAPSDFSKRELEQLARSKQKQRRDQTQTQNPRQAQQPPPASRLTPHTSMPCDEYFEGIRDSSVDAFVTARDRVRKSNKEKGIQDSGDMCGLLFHLLPSNVWFGDFFKESKDDFGRVQKRMNLEYSNEFCRL